MGKYPRRGVFYPRLKAEKARARVEYHGRHGHPTIHWSQPCTRPSMKQARPYIMVRKEGGGTERLHLNSKRATEINGITKLRQEARRIKKRQMKTLKRKKR